MQSLYLISNGVMDDLAQAICKEMSLSQLELQRRAKIVFSAVLHNYSELSICTIDSFMVRVVRTFARDLNLNGNFEVELDNKYLAEYIVDTMMSLVGVQNNDALTNIVCTYATAQMDDAKTNNIIELLKKSAEYLFKENARHYVDILTNHKTDDFLKDRKSLLEKNVQYEGDLKKLAHHALDEAKALSLDQNDFPGKSKGIYHFVENIASNGAPITNNTLKDIYERRSIIPNNAKDPVIATLSPVDDTFMGVINFMYEGLEAYNTRRVLINKIYDMALLGKMREIENNYFQDNEATNLTEVSHKISDEVKNQPAPFLYERLGEKYHHFLIDEFQDTSKEQWFNLLPLIIGGVSEGQRSLVVGDAKQAIYRFRQGDVKQFIDLPHVDFNNKVDTIPHTTLLERPGISEERPLTKNFRSRNNIVGFNNQFFKWLITEKYYDNKLLQQIYIGKDSNNPALIQEYVKEGGYIEASFWDRENMLFELTSIIQHLSNEIGLEYGDITILADRKSFLNEISDYLGSQGIRVASSESALVSSSLAVRLIRCLLKQLLRPNDDSNNMLVDFYLKRIECKEKAPVSHWNTLNLYDLVEELLRHYQLYAKDPAMCASLLNQVSHYCSTHPQNLFEFVDFLDDKWDDMATNVPANPNAVKLMTVHKSKGLQSPVIIYYLPVTNPRSNHIWVNVDPNLSDIEVGLVRLKQNENTSFNNERDAEAFDVEMDNVNRRYVALTRAEDALFLLCEHKGMPKKENDNLTFQQQIYSFFKNNNAEEKQRNLSNDVFGSFFSIGDLARHNEKSKSANENHFSMANISFPSWQNRLIAAEQKKKFLNETQNKKILRGLQTHAILSEVHSQTDVESAVELFAVANDLSDEDQNALLVSITKIVTCSDCERFFIPEASTITEMPIIYENEEIRPDRIIFTKKDTTVVDFKTGIPSEKDVEQVKKYCLAVAEMGYKNVSGFLLYIGEGINVKQVI